VKIHWPTLVFQSLKRCKPCKILTVLKFELKCVFPFSGPTTGSHNQRNSVTTASAGSQTIGLYDG
jgi:hypothetical protein